MVLLSIAMHCPENVLVRRGQAWAWRGQGKAHAQILARGQRLAGAPWTHMHDLYLIPERICIRCATHIAEQMRASALE